MTLHARSDGVFRARDCGIHGGGFVLLIAMAGRE